ncbi:MAG: 50S ribosomal protein L9 [Candidatus Marinimicrobia bacterium]|nr:50S ribosomal protein L9 [Candidatus Neomarinimicrobiota bacterium]MBL7108974.1 50S ribosomal protein L9 [Candidatus Neomarinimicrobiota bacterium]
MKIILTQTIESLGAAGEIITVKDGYARNYLIPRGMAMEATKKTIATVQKNIDQTEIKEAKARENLESLVKQLNKLTLKFTLKAGEEEKLFGSVTSQMIADAIVSKGYQIDKKEIDLHEPLKHVGNHFVDIKVGKGLTGRIKVKVAAEK